MIFGLGDMSALWKECIMTSVHYDINQFWHECIMDGVHCDIRETAFTYCTSRPSRRFGPSRRTPRPYTRQTRRHRYRWGNTALPPGSWALETDNNNKYRDPVNTYKMYWSAKQPTSPTINQSTNWPTNQPVNKATWQSINQTTSQSMNQYLPQTSGRRKWLSSHTHRSCLHMVLVSEHALSGNRHGSPYLPRGTAKIMSTTIHCKYAEK